MCSLNVKVANLYPFKFRDVIPLTVEARCHFLCQGAQPKAGKEGIKTHGENIGIIDKCSYVHLGQVKTWNARMIDRIISYLK